MFGAMAAALVDVAVRDPRRSATSGVAFADRLRRAARRPPRAVHRRRPRRCRRCADRSPAWPSARRSALGLLLGAGVHGRLGPGRAVDRRHRARRRRPVRVRRRGLADRARALRRALRAVRDHRPRRVGRRDRRRRRGRRRRSGSSWPRSSAWRIAAGLWWLYFDVVSDRSPPSGWPRLPPGRPATSSARDAWAYLHFPMVAGIVLVAFGLKSTLAHVGDPLGAMPARRPARRCGAVPARPRRLPAAGDGDAQRASGCIAGRRCCVALVPRRRHG